MGLLGTGWLYAKLALFVLLVINGPFVARPAAMQLLGALESGDAVAAPLKRLEVFHTVQVAGLVGIVLLAVLKPF